MIIDLRSDTVTQPTEEMKSYMMEAVLGDDVLGDDPTVIELEKKAAERFGKEAALFCPSGTMTNQIAIKVHTNAPGEVICSDLSHIYWYEGGGIAFNSGLSVRLIAGDRGRFTAEDVKKNINADDVHFPKTQLVSLENTCNKGGGCCWDQNEVNRISKLCKAEGIPLHLDGARMYNAIVAKGIDEKEFAAPYDSISLCLSKGLGCPVGSLLIGSNEFIYKARRVRKVMGGGMRQVGLLAAAGIYALEHNIDRLSDDHENAAKIADVLKDKSFVKSISPVETNILIFELNDDVKADDFIKSLADKDILAVGMGHQKIRFVTHLGIGDEEMEELLSVLASQ
ncbi:MAG: threonine aldolase [Flavobacteriales bacterium]|nr:threonine aldolase [Flavobacteriales bacterium]